MKTKSITRKLVLSLTVILGLLSIPATTRAASISCGQTVASTTTTDSENDQYTFSGSAGQVISLSLSSSLVGTPAMEADIYSPSASLIATVTVGFQYSNYGGAASNLILPTTGTYTILVHSRDYAGTGNYQLSLQTVTAGGCSSRPVTCGQTLTNTSTFSSEMDAYSFAGTGGQIISLSLSSTQVGTPAMTADIYNPSGNLIATVTVGFQYSNYGGAASNVILPTSGTYTIVVHSQGYVGSGYYELSLQTVTAGGCGSRPVTCGQTLTNTSTFSSEMDAYSLAGTGGQIISLSLSSTLVGTPAMTADIYDPSGNLIATVTVGFQYSNYGGAAKNLTLPTSGVYTIVVHSQGYVGSGYYELSLQTVTAGGCGSRPVTCGQTLTNTSTFSSEMDAYGLAGNGGQMVSLSLSSSLVGTPAMTADIYDPSGNLIATVTVGFQYSNYGGAASDLTLPASGIYTILVHSQGYVGSGYYELSLQTVTGGGCSSRSIACGQTINSGTIHTSEMDAYGFATSGGTVIFSFSGYSGARFDLHDPTGNTILTGTPGTGPSTNLEAGTYTILVHDAGYVGSGSYGLTVTCIGSPCNPTINPTGPISVGSSATNSTIVVTNGPGCGWTATANTNWLHITSGSSGSGNGTVTYSVDANPVASARSGTMTIAGFTIIVNQANPVPFAGQDIGAPGAPGSFSYSNGTYTLSGSGEGTDGSADVFYYLHQTLSGNGQILARLTSLQGGDPNLAEAGIMIRQSLDPGSEQVSLSVNASTNVIFRRRLATDAISMENSFQGSNYLQGTNDIWLRLMRMGNTLVAHYSTNGLNWQYMWFATLNMTNPVNVGLEVTAHHYGELATATFDNVSTGSLTPLSGAWPLPGPLLLTGGQNWSPAEFQRVGGCEFLLAGAVGDYFSINDSTNITAPFSSWQRLGMVTNTYGVVPVLDVQASNNNVRFYCAQRMGGP